MAVSIVNGYFCASCCDVAKAKKGEDPHPATNPDGPYADKNADKNDPLRANDPAVLFGGALSTLTADAAQPTDSTSATDPSTAPPTGQAIDILA